jgi:hypothetical protein
MHFSAYLRYFIYFIEVFLLQETWSNTWDKNTNINSNPTDTDIACFHLTAYSHHRINIATILIL